MQAAFRKESEKLQALGITYPKGFGKHAQHVLAKISAQNTQAKRFHDISRLTKRHSTVLLASEFFSEQDAESLQALKDVLGPDVHVEVIFSYRRLEQLVPSQYQQFIRTGYREDLAFFAKSILEKDESHHEAKLFWRRHLASKILKDWADVFGAANIHQVIVDRKNPDLLIRWFERYLGLQTQALQSVAETRLNRSLDAEEIELVKTLFSHLSPKRVAREWAVIFRDKFIADIASRPSTNPNSSSLRLNRDMSVQFEQIADQEQKIIQQLGINLHGTMPSADAWTGDAAPQTPSSIHIETVARAIVAIRPDHHIRQASIREMAREIWYRIQRRLKRAFSKK